MLSICFIGSINGTPSCANDWLMNGVARGEWGFQGFFISDAGAIRNQVRELPKIFNNNDIDVTQ